MTSPLLGKRSVNLCTLTVNCTYYHIQETTDAARYRVTHNGDGTTSRSACRMRHASALNGHMLSNGMLQTEKLRRPGQACGPTTEPRGRREGA
eukprot:UN5057